MDGDTRRTIGTVLRLIVGVGLGAAALAIAGFVFGASGASAAERVPAGLSTPGEVGLAGAPASVAASVVHAVPGAVTVPVVHVVQGAAAVPVVPATHSVTQAVAAPLVHAVVQAIPSSVPPVVEAIPAAILTATPLSVVSLAPVSLAPVSLAPTPLAPAALLNGSGQRDAARQGSQTGPAVLSGGAPVVAPAKPVSPVPAPVPGPSGVASARVVAQSAGSAVAEPNYTLARAVVRTSNAITNSGGLPSPAFDHDISPD